MSDKDLSFVKSDVVVIGAEFESFVAAMRLAERGVRVRVLMPGSGSLHYAAGGLGVLGINEDASPFSSMPDLGQLHPYNVIGEDRVRMAIEWFLRWLDGHTTPWHSNARNVHALTMLGRSASLFAIPPSLATFESVGNRNLAIVDIDGHNDFLPDLCAAGLARRGIDVSLVHVSTNLSGDSVRIARSLDRDCSSFFDAVRQALPAKVDAVIFPAVLGLKSPATVRRMAAEKLEADIYEVATLPPSLFGLRLHQLLVNALTTAGAYMHPNVRGLRGEFANETCRFLRDENGQRYEADRFILGNGGVLLGGLEVDSYGEIHEPICELDVVQTEPLAIRDPLLVPDSLHRAGVRTDEFLRPFRNGRPVENLFATGALLANWNPIQERSNEGVAIASGTAAADFAIGAPP